MRGVSRFLLAGTAVLLLTQGVFAAGEKGPYDRYLPAKQKASAALSGRLSEALRLSTRGKGAEEPRILLRSYDTENIYLKNAAFSYDNALAAMAFLSEGKQEEAKMLLDAFAYAIENDRYQPGQVRNAYAAGDIRPSPGQGEGAKLPGWYDPSEQAWCEDAYQCGCNTGNTSFVALAFLQYDARYGSEEYVRCAGRLLDGIIQEGYGKATKVGEPPYGFPAGYEGWPEKGIEDTSILTYRSTEHNIDLYAACRRLYKRTGQERYQKAADSALLLIRSMYDAQRGMFYTGTLADGITPNRDILVLDCQVWSCLCLGEDFSPYAYALEVLPAMQTQEGGFPFYYDPQAPQEGWWAEGTAFTALLYQLRGEEEMARKAFDALAGIQLEDGFFPAATVEHLSTGFTLSDGSPLEYGTTPHLAPTAWFIMAVNGFNPFTFPQAVA